MSYPALFFWLSLEKCPHPRGLPPVRHGDTIPNYRIPQNPPKIPIPTAEFSLRRTQPPIGIGNNQPYNTTPNHSAEQIITPEVRLPGSAIIVFVVDESGSMIGEHRWLQDTIMLLEAKLLAHGVGVFVPNRYALVGFAHNDPKDSGRRMGKVLEDCTTAYSVANAISSLHTDGYLEDGYS